MKERFILITNNSKTPAEECKGYKEIKYKAISNNKCIRLVSIDNLITPEPYIVEIVEKTASNTGYTYVAKPFTSQADAEDYMNNY